MKPAILASRIPLSVEFDKTSDFESTVTNLRPLQDVEVVDKGGFSALLIGAEKIVNDHNNPMG